MARGPKTVPKTVLAGKSLIFTYPSHFYIILLAIEPKRPNSITPITHGKVIEFTPIHPMVSYVDWADDLPAPHG